VDNLCNGPHVTIQVATDSKKVDPTVMVRTSLTEITYAKLASDQPYAEENANSDVRRLVYEAYVSPTVKSFEVITAETIGHNTFTVGKTVQVSGCNTGSLFDSGIVKPGSTFEFTFSNAGDYNYFCTIHPWMMGQVIVGNVTFIQQPDSTQPAIIISMSKATIVPEFGPMIGIIVTTAIIGSIAISKKFTRI
jgi:plastocyanin